MALIVSWRAIRDGGLPTAQVGGMILAIPRLHSSLSLAHLQSFSVPSFLLDSSGRMLLAGCNTRLPIRAVIVGRPTTRFIKVEIIGS